MKHKSLLPSLLTLLLTCLTARPVPAAPMGATTTQTTGPAYGALVIAVDTPTDSNQPTYQACTAAPEDCSLRGAISKANADADNEYTVILPADTYTLALAGTWEDANATGDLDVVTGTLTIEGAGAASTVIDADQLDRVLHVHAGADVTVTGVSFTNGHAPVGAGAGGVHNAGTLEMSYTALYSNTAGVGQACYGDLCEAGTGGYGGGVYNAGTLELAHSAVYSNTAGAGGFCSGTTCDAGFGGDGGGLYDVGTLQLVHSAVYSNRDGAAGSCSGYACETYVGGCGGGMASSSSSPQLVNVTFSGNQSNSYGGGMCSYSGSPQLANVTFSGNHALGSGGGMFNQSGSAQLTNVTFSGNHTDSGGGMCNWDSSPTLKNCVLWGNTASFGSQVFNYSSAPIINYSLVEGGCPSGSTCDGHLLTVNPQFVRDPDPGDGDWATPGDNDYGDLRLRSTSPAIDAGDNAALPPDALDLDGDGDTAEPIPYDLDGKWRIVNGLVDMGAYEAHTRIFCR